MARRDQRTLSSTVLSACIGRVIEVELKTDVIIHGILDDCDQSMNLVLGRCEIRHRTLTESFPKTELMFVTGKNVRYVLLDGLSIVDLMQEAWTRRQYSSKQKRVILDQRTQSKRQRA